MFSEPSTKKKIRTWQKRPLKSGMTCSIWIQQQAPVIYKNMYQKISSAKYQWYNEILANPWAKQKAYEKIVFHLARLMQQFNSSSFLNLLYQFLHILIVWNVRWKQKLTSWNLKEQCPFVSHVPFTSRCPKREKTWCHFNQHTETCFLEACEFISSSSSASPILKTTALALSISAQAKDFSWLTNFLASSEACKHKNTLKSKQT